MPALNTQIIAPAIGSAEVADYLTADFGHDLALWRDGTVQIIESALTWRDNDDAPVARAKCPGIGNLDSSVFTADFCERDEDSGEYIEISTGRIIGDLEAVVRECCRDGDVEAFRDDLIAALAASVETE